MCISALERSRDWAPSTALARGVHAACTSNTLLRGVLTSSGWHSCIDKGANAGKQPSTSVCHPGTSAGPPWRPTGELGPGISGPASPRAHSCTTGAHCQRPSAACLRRHLWPYGATSCGLLSGLGAWVAVRLLPCFCAWQSVHGTCAASSLPRSTFTRDLEGTRSVF